MIRKNNTPQMAALKKINEENKAFNKTPKCAPYVANKNTTTTSEQVCVKKPQKANIKKKFFLTGNPVDEQEIKNIKNYKEPQKTKQNTPEMAKLKKIKKPRQRRLIVVKQTRSKPVQRSLPKPRKVFPDSKKIHVL